MLKYGILQELYYFIQGDSCSKVSKLKIFLFFEIYSTLLNALNEFQLVLGYFQLVNGHFKYNIHIINCFKLEKKHFVYNRNDQQM